MLGFIENVIHASLRELIGLLGQLAAAAGQERVDSTVLAVALCAVADGGERRRLQGLVGEQVGGRERCRPGSARLGKLEHGDVVGLVRPARGEQRVRRGDAADSLDTPVDQAVEVLVEVLVEGHRELDVLGAVETVSGSEEDRRADQGAGAPLERASVGDRPDQRADVGVASVVEFAERDRAGGTAGSDHGGTGEQSGEADGEQATRHGVLQFNCAGPPTGRRERIRPPAVPGTADLAGRESDVRVCRPVAARARQGLRMTCVLPGLSPAGGGRGWSPPARRSSGRPGGPR